MSRLRLQYACALQPGPVHRYSRRSIDLNGPLRWGPGEFTWWTIWRMKARKAHNQTT